MQRAARLWKRWDAQVRAGRSREELLRELTDESLAEMAAYVDPCERRYDANLFLTELLNRILVLRANLVAATQFAEACADAAAGAPEVRGRFDGVVAATPAPLSVEAIRGTLASMRAQALARARTPEKEREERGEELSSSGHAGPP